jgi:hypothetical protein
MVPLHLLTFAVIALLCHGALADDRPEPEHLTAFYLWLSVGGALGGVFNTIVAPVVFSGVYEYPVLLSAACFVLARSDDYASLFRQPALAVRPLSAGVLAFALLMVGLRFDVDLPRLMVMLGIALVVCFSVSKARARFAIGIASLLLVAVLFQSRVFGRVVEADRTFFGVYRVTLDSEHNMVSLFHGTTLHGRQIFGASQPEPLTYYHRGGPIGQLLERDGGSRPRSVGVVGLGVGSLAAYVQPNDRWTFYEIDPVVERLARDSRYFHYLERCGDRCAVSLGDARLSLSREPLPTLDASNGAYDVLVLDAFSSDAIPVHLLTTNALRLYASRLAPHGVMAFHISNRHIALRPVLARLAASQHLAAFARLDLVEADRAWANSSSDWVVMAKDETDLQPLASDPRWTRLAADDVEPWTDDFSNIWTAIRWK